MKRLSRLEWRLPLIAVLVGALLSLYPASKASAQRQDKDDDKSNHGQMNKVNKEDGKKHFERSGDKHFDRQGDSRRFDRRSVDRSHDFNTTHSRDDNRWRDRDGDRTRTYTRDHSNDDRWRHDGNRDWSDRRDANFRYQRDGRWYRDDWSHRRDTNYRYQHDGRWYRHQGDWSFRRPQTRVVYVFVPEQRERMREYFYTHRSALPRYYYNDYYDDVPYDTRRDLVVNGYFPEYLEDRAYPFPSALDRLLGPAPYGTRRVMFGRDAFLLQNGSNRILDIIQDIARL